MVHQLQAQGLQALELFVILRQETYVDVGRPQVQPPGFLRIQGTHGDRHMFQGIRVRESLSQYDHFVSDAGKVHGAGLVRIPVPVRAPGQQAYRKQFQQSLHSFKYFSPQQKYGEGAV